MFSPHSFAKRDFRQTIRQTYEAWLNAWKGSLQYTPLHLAEYKSVNVHDNIVKFHVIKTDENMVRFYDKHIVMNPYKDFTVGEFGLSNEVMTRLSAAWLKMHFVFRVPSELSKDKLDNLLIFEADDIIVSEKKWLKEWWKI